MNLGVGVSQKAKGTREGFVVNQSIITRPSAKEGYHEAGGGRAWRPERLIGWEEVAMKKREMRMGDLGMWAREGNEGIGRG
jgi:hypothetical protein